MLNVTNSMKIYVYTAVADMRKGVDGLSGMVRSELGADPADGSVFVFINRRRDRMKILHFDGGGFWLYYRILEAGTFEDVNCQTICLTLRDSSKARRYSDMRIECSSCFPPPPPACDQRHSEKPSNAGEAGTRWDQCRSSRYVKGKLAHTFALAVWCGGKRVDTVLAKHAGSSPPEIA